MTSLKSGVKLGLMKKLSLYIFLFLMWCNAGFADVFVYNCNLNTKFKSGTDGDWEQKYVKFTISSSDNKKIKIYDHEIEGYYSPEMIIITDDIKFIHAVSVDTFSGLESLSINKKNGYTQLIFLSGYGGTTVHFGYCK